MKAKLSILSAACAAVLYSNSVMADTVVFGKVTNANNTQMFAGASIEIKELKVKTQTSSEG